MAGHILPLCAALQLQVRFTSISSLGKLARVFQFVAGFSALLMHTEGCEIWVKWVTVESTMEASLLAWR